MADPHVHDCPACNHYFICHENTCTEDDLCAACAAEKAGEPYCPTCHNSGVRGDGAECTACAKPPERR